MNKVILIGRLVRDPDVRTGTNDVKIARYTLAVDRSYRKNNERVADFINCVALGHNGEFVEKYLHKGTKIAVTGSWQTGKYIDRDGKKNYTNDCLVESHEFVESKKNQTEQSLNTQPNISGNDTEDFMDAPVFIEDDDLPFS